MVKIGGVKFATLLDRNIEASDPASYLRRNLR